MDAGSLQRDYLDEVFAYISRRVPTREDAEDATAETFAAAFASIRRFRGDDPRCWLLGIARRKVADSLRRSKRRRDNECHLDMDVAMPPSDATRLAELRRIVLGLPAHQREAIMLQHLEGLSVAEVAEVMGKSVSATNSLLQRARESLYRAGKDFFLNGDL